MACAQSHAHDHRLVLHAGCVAARITDAAVIVHAFDRAPSLPHFFLRTSVPFSHEADAGDAKSRVARASIAVAEWPSGAMMVGDVGRSMKKTEKKKCEAMCNVFFV